MHVCNPAHVWTLQRLAIWSTFWLPTTFLSFWNLCRSSSRLCFPVPLWTYAAPLPSSPFLSFVASQNSFNSIKLQISNPRFPLLLFTLSNTPTQSYTTVLSISQDTLQSSNTANLVELHASLLVVQDVQSTWPKVRKGNPPGSTNITSILFSDYTSTKGSAISNVGKSHWQSSIQRP